jgi:hypothetical protein
MRRIVDDSAYLAMVRRVIRAAGPRIGGCDVEDLGALVALRQELDAAIVQAVSALRHSGNTWAAIGAATGTSKEAAVQKWAKRVV